MGKVGIKFVSIISLVINGFVLALENVWQTFLPGMMDFAIYPGELLIFPDILDH